MKKDFKVGEYYIDTVDGAIIKIIGEENCTWVTTRIIKQAEQAVGEAYKVVSKGSIRSNRISTLRGLFKPYPKLKGMMYED